MSPRPGVYAAITLLAGLAIVGGYALTATGFPYGPVVKVDVTVPDGYLGTLRVVGADGPPTRVNRHYRWQADELGIIRVPPGSHLGPVLEWSARYASGDPIHLAGLSDREIRLFLGAEPIVGRIEDYHSIAESNRWRRETLRNTDPAPEAPWAHPSLEPAIRIRGWVDSEVSPSGRSFTAVYERYRTPDGPIVIVQTTIQQGHPEAVLMLAIEQNDVLYLRWRNRVIVQRDGTALAAYGNQEPDTIRRFVGQLKRQLR